MLLVLVWAQPGSFSHFTEAELGCREGGRLARGSQKWDVCPILAPSFDSTVLAWSWGCGGGGTTKQPSPQGLDTGALVPCSGPCREWTKAGSSHFPLDCPTNIYRRPRTCPALRRAPRNGGGQEGLEGIGYIVSHISGCSAEFEEARVAPSGFGLVSPWGWSPAGWPGRAYG